MKPIRPGSKLTVTIKQAAHSGQVQGGLLIFYNSELLLSALTQLK